MMHRQLISIRIILLTVIPLLGTLGCDDRATQIALEAADRQARQNTAMAELNKEVASGTHQLVEADAQARKEIVGVHRDLQAERTRLDAGRNDLEMDRREIAGRRRIESALVAVVPLVGGGLLTALVLGFCWFVLIGAYRDPSAAQLNELLVQEILTTDPALTIDGSPPQRIRADTSLRLEGE